MQYIKHSGILNKIYKALKFKKQPRRQMVKYVELQEENQMTINIIMVNLTNSGVKQTKITMRYYFILIGSIKPI